MKDTRAPSMRTLRDQFNQRQSQALSHPAKVAMGTPLLGSDMGVSMGMGGDGAVPHLLSLILVGLLTVFLLEFCPLFEGLLLWAAQE